MVTVDAFAIVSYLFGSIVAVWPSGSLALAAAVRAAVVVVVVVHAVAAVVFAFVAVFVVLSAAAVDVVEWLVFMLMLLLRFSRLRILLPLLLSLLEKRIRLGMRSKQVILLLQIL